LPRCLRYLKIIAGKFIIKLRANSRMLLGLGSMGQIACGAYWWQVTIVYTFLTYVPPVICVMINENHVNQEGVIYGNTKQEA
jgi:hypothetical protein